MRRRTGSDGIGRMSVPDAGSPRPVSALLTDGAVSSFLAGKLLSSVALWAQSVAAAAVMFELTGSALMVGVVGTLQTAPTAVLALAAGAWSDRVSRRRLLAVGRALAGAAMLTLGATAALGILRSTAGPWVLAALVGVSGVGWAIGSPSMSALLPTLVEPEDLESALSLNAMIPGVARTAGPLVGGVLLLAGGPTAAFVIAGGGHIVFSLALALIREPARDPVAVKPRMLGGVDYLRRDRRALRLVVGIGLLNFGAEPAFTLAPSIAADPEVALPSLSLIVATFGAGALVGAALFRAARRHLALGQVSVVGCSLCAGGLIVAALAPGPLPVLAGFLLNGFGFILASVSISTRLQQRIPDSHRGRVMAIWSLAFFGMRPLSALMNGGLTDRAGWRLAVAASALVTGAAVMLVREGRR